MEKISIISSIYNKSLYLDRFFNSVLSQSYSNIEIVAVDNASTDDSLSIIEKYALQDSRIKIIHVDINRGPSGGYMTGVNNVDGEYFTFIDSDDFVDTDYIEKLYTAIKTEDADVAMCISNLVWEDGRSWHKPWPDKTKYIIEGKDVKKLSLQMFDELNTRYYGFPMAEIGAVWGKLYRTSFIIKNKINYDEGYYTWCDYIFNLRVIKKIKKLVYINTTSYHFYQSDNSVTRPNEFHWESIDRILFAVNRIYEESQDIMNPEIEQATNRFYFERIRNIAYICYEFYPHVISANELNNVIEKFRKSPAGIQLFSTKRFPRFTIEKRFLLYSFEHAKTIFAIKLLKALNVPLKIFGSVYNTFNKIF